MRKVFLADDHGIVLAGVRRLLERDPAFAVVGEAQHARQVLKLAPDADWDVLVLDLSLPGGGGMEVLARIRQLRPSVRVVVYTMYPETEYARAALAGGARAYVCKARHPQALLDALHAVVRGEVFVSSDVEVGPPEEALTARESQILQLLTESKTPSQIADELGVSRSTISTHIGQLKRKLEVDSIGGLVRHALLRAGSAGGDSGGESN